MSFKQIFYKNHTLDHLKFLLTGQELHKVNIHINLFNI